MNHPTKVHKAGAIAGLLILAALLFVPSIYCAESMDEQQQSDVPVLQISEESTPDQSEEQKQEPENETEISEERTDLFLSEKSTLTLEAEAAGDGTEKTSAEDQTSEDLADENQQEAQDYRMILEKMEKEAVAAEDPEEAGNPLAEEEDSFDFGATPLETIRALFPPDVNDLMPQEETLWTDQPEDPKWAELKYFLNELMTALETEQQPFTDEERMEITTAGENGNFDELTLAPGEGDPESWATDPGFFVYENSPSEGEAPQNEEQLARHEEKLDEAVHRVEVALKAVQEKLGEQGEVDHREKAEEAHAENEARHEEHKQAEKVEASQAFEARGETALSVSSLKADSLIEKAFSRNDFTPAAVIERKETPKPFRFEASYMPSAPMYTSIASTRVAATAPVAMAGVSPFLKNQDEPFSSADPVFSDSENEKKTRYQGYEYRPFVTNASGSTQSQSNGGETKEGYVYHFGTN